MEKPTRFSLALDFACAAITVLFAGRVADSLLQKAGTDGIWASALEPVPDPRVNRRINNTVHHASELLLTDMGIATWSERQEAMSAGASNLRVRCALRILQTARYWAKKEPYGDVEESSADKFARECLTHFLPSPFTVDRREFLRGGKYFGVYVRVARKLTVYPSRVGDVGRGRRGHRTILLAIRAEMAKVDAEIAAREASK